MIALSAALWAAVGALAIATAALMANPGREINRTLAAVSVAFSLWFGALHGFLVNPSQVWLLRLAWIALGFSPPILAWLRHILVRPRLRWRDRAKASRRWSAYTVGFVGLASTPWFLEADPFTGAPSYGPLYSFMAAAGVAVHAIFAVSSFSMMRKELGAPRLDLQLLALGGVLGASVTHALLGLAPWFGRAVWDRVMPLLVLALFGGTVWSLLTTRVLDARRIVTLGIEKAVLVAGVTVFIWGIDQLTSEFVPSWLSLGLSVALGLWFAAEVRPWLQEVSQRKAAAEQLRRTAVEIAREDLRPDAMEDSFARLLREWAHCDRAVILMASHGKLTGGGIEWDVDRPEMKLLHSLRWATPERLERERRRLHGNALAALMRREGLGAMVASAGPSLSFLVAVGVPRHHRPFTFPEIGQLLGLESIIESALARAHYLMKAQHADQLATVGLLGASIAHEIRNPLVTIKTFVQLLPHHHQEAAFRDKFFRLMSDEVGRIDRLTEQLLDLSAPRAFNPRPLALAPLIEGCVELLKAKATDKATDIQVDFQAFPDIVFSDADALKQVVLNLGLNALQAVEAEEGVRWIRLSTRNLQDQVELACEDSGPGLSSEVAERLFQPFHSTKSSGFGLGLAICKDILSSLQASITADPPLPGRGATFRVILPCQPPTS